jgi:hypothetical protein
MFKHNVTYKDFNGIERKEDFYFHLSLPEVTRLQAEFGEDIGTHAKKLADGQDAAALLEFMERIMLSAYGRKTSDGKSFHKSPELRKEFEYSQAYAEMFEEMMNNPDLAKRFGEAVADNGKPKKNQPQPQVVHEQQ